ncbi:hypothetical protein [Massilia sp. TWP1-3-3]|uniref:hypothetical protein n=1 Tax=Massilia sp. TWP1-3-3 TaxID=2804573 RepID=UPI003CF063C0
MAIGEGSGAGAGMGSGAGAGADTEAGTGADSVTRAGGKTGAGAAKEDLLADEPPPQAVRIASASDPITRLLIVRISTCFSRSAVHRMTVKPGSIQKDCAWVNPGCGKNKRIGAKLKISWMMLKTSCRRADMGG